MNTPRWPPRDDPRLPTRSPKPSPFWPAIGPVSSTALSCRSTAGALRYDALTAKRRQDRHRVHRRDNPLTGVTTSPNRETDHQAVLMLSRRPIQERRKQWLTLNSASG